MSFSEFSIWGWGEGQQPVPGKAGSLRRFGLFHSVGSWQAFVTYDGSEIANSVFHHIRFC